ncbi:Stage V sporulation protein D [Anoxybacillus sp. BCO1]|nr:Stage V sporulation protein D [Anoxybacillus sp. BCO1]
MAQGTGKGAFVDGYRVGGKTGTAQKAKDGQYLKDNHIVSFIGFAPADDPQIVVYVAVDNPKGTVQFGGVVAAPIVGNIMEDSLRALGVKPRKQQIEKRNDVARCALCRSTEFNRFNKKRFATTAFSLKIRW